MHRLPPCKPHIAIIAVDVSQSVDLDQGAYRDRRCTLRVTSASHGRAHLLQHDRRSDPREPAMPTTNITERPLTYLAAFALLAGPLAAKSGPSSLRRTSRGARRRANYVFRPTGRSAIVPSPSRYKMARETAQNAGYSQPPPLLVNSQPLAPCTRKIEPSISSASGTAIHEA